MAHFDWTEYTLAMEDLQNLPLPDLTFDDFTLDNNNSDTQSLPPPSDFRSAAPAATSHPSDLPFSCSSNACGCGKAFRRRSDLKKHIDQRTRPYPCQHPGCTIRSFSSKHDRDRHQREVHEGGSPTGSATKLRCPVVSCKRHARGFARKENLALHVRNMHPKGTLVTPPTMTREPSSASPTTPAMPLSPTETFTTLSSSPKDGVASDAVLLAGLNDRLASLHARREALARQLAAVDETIEAVSRTVEGLQSPQEPEMEMVEAVGEWESWDWLNEQPF